jgi:hypothetical protein
MHRRTERVSAEQLKNIRSSSPMMHYIRIPFVKKKYSEGCSVDNPARKKMKYEHIEHEIVENVKRIENQHGKQILQSATSTPCVSCAL